MTNLLSKTFLVTTVAAGALYAGALRAEDGKLVQTNLVSDIPGLAAITDPQLHNPWGVSHSPTSPFWISNQGTSTATLYTVTDETNVTKVNINPPSGFVVIPKFGSGPAQGPTGQVSNTNTACFPVSVNSGGDGKFAHFIFANLNGTISAWDMGPTAFIQVTTHTTPATVYTGLAINGAQTRLYAANDAGTGSIDVYDCSFKPVNLGPDAFKDPSLPAGLVPFNVQHIGGDVYVTYTPAGLQNMRQAPMGAGAVAIFDEDGNFIQELSPAAASPHPGGSPSHHPVSAASAMMCWSATSAFSIAKSTPSSQATVSCTGRSRSTRAVRARVVFGRSSLGSAAITAALMSSISLTGSMARPTGCSAR